MTESGLRNDRHLSMNDLVARINDGDIDTVVVAFTDMQGRLQGKRLHGRYFADIVVDHGTEGCNYLLAVDVDMNTVGGYSISSWERGYGDMEFVLDERTIRVLTHLPATAMVQCDLVWLDHSPVVQSPRTILSTQLQKAADKGWDALAGTELEFIAFDTTYEAAADSAYRDLTPVNQYNIDYSILGTTRVEPLLRAIRNTMYDAGLDVEGAKGECNFGQHEIGFLYADALDHRRQPQRLQDRRQGDRRPAGQGDHLHGEVQRARGQLLPHPPLAARPGRLAGLLGRRRRRTARSSTTTSWPASSRRSRTSRSSTRPTSTPTSGSRPARSRRPRSPWGTDNRTCSVRLVGHGAGARMENRVPGADANPYLALAAMLAGGLHGIEHELTLEPELVGNAYESDAEHVPSSLAAARERFASSELARSCFGDEVVDHYTNMADVELAAYGAAVTDWELRRGFERL